jgi:hypothetical protein
MVNQIDSPSPFSSGASSNQRIPADTENFSIHTMQEDLLNLQKKAEQPGASAEINIPSATQPNPFPATQMSQLSQDNLSPEKTPPFIEHVSGSEEIMEVPVPEKDPNYTFYKIILITVVVLVVAIIGLGGYYFWITRTPKQAPIVQAPVETEQPAETPAQTPAEKYSAEKPNYLSLDLASLSPEEIRASVVSVAEELKTANLARTPYEFIVTDANNNPVAFPIFTLATKLNLAPAVLSNLGENFSLFLYNDAGNMRLSLAIDVNNKNILTAEMTKQEKTFITDAAFLFLNAKPEIATGAFQDNNTNPDALIRFINVNVQKNLSIDYSIINSQLIIATSKNTMGAVLDKIVLKESLPKATDTTNTSLPGNTTNNNSLPPDEGSGQN